MFILKDNFSHIVQKSANIRIFNYRTVICAKILSQIIGIERNLICVLPKFFIVSIYRSKCL